MSMGTWTQGHGGEAGTQVQERHMMQAQHNTLENSFSNSSMSIFIISFFSSLASFWNNVARE